MSKNFFKIQALGNDFIVFDSRERDWKPSVKKIRELCDRRRGIGADGILILLKSRKADYRMRIFNSDGSEAQMCGNGIRCIALYLYHYKIAKKNNLRIETKAGEILVRRLGKAFEIDLGMPSFEPSSIPLNLSEPMIDMPIELEGNRFKATALSMGNPHLVIPVPWLKNVPLSDWGPKLEHHHFFPERTNVEFVQIISPEKLALRVWERGAGETLACGTGACATLVACFCTGRARRKAEVILPGGRLEVEYREKNGHCYLVGDAKLVYKGELI